MANIAVMIFVMERQMIPYGKYKEGANVRHS